jgi:arylsulfatase
MKNELLSFIACLAFLLASAMSMAGAAESRPPNILIILADDSGFSDLGCYGSEIRTPNLDALAAEGLRFTQFYNTARCWPTRAALLTGYYAQEVNRDALPGGHGGSQGKRPAWAKLLPEHLRPLGYRSYHSGKWHIDGKPLESGFDRSYRLEDYNHNFSPKEHFLDDRPLPPVQPGEGYYSTTAIAQHAVDFLKQHAAEQGDQPFFEYVAFTVPHFPLQAPPEDVARYADKYTAGWDAMRAARFARIEEKLHLPGKLSPLEPRIGPPSKHPAALKQLGPGEVGHELSWNELTPEQQRFQADKMAIHAAMVDRMDQEIGRLVAQLRAMNAYENTLIFFLSDNGASAEIMIRGDGHNSDAPLGSAETFLCLGPGFSRASNTPFRRHKTWVHEGGIATPLIVHWPAGIRAAGELRHTPGHVIDFAPTILHLAGGAWPKPAAKGLPPATPGTDLSPAFASDTTISRAPLWWLHEGNRALRHGDWKIVAAKGDPWELYDLSRDRTETVNLASQQPDRVKTMAEQWEKMTKELERISNTE